MLGWRREVNNFNFTKHVLHRHMKNSTKSGPNKSGLKDAENGASPASSDTNSDCRTIDSHYFNDDSTSQDTLNRKEQSSRQSSQSGLSTTERSPSEILLDNVQAKEGTTSSHASVHTPENSSPFPGAHVPETASENLNV
jgi:hypothetical protein